MYNHNMNITSNKINSERDELDIKQIFQTIWQGKFFIISLTSLFSIVAVLYSLYLPNIYQSNAILNSVDQQNNGSSMGNIGALAGLAGINVSSGSGNNSTLALEKIVTFSFFKNNILPNIFLPDLMAMKSWDADNGLVYDDTLFNKSTKTWNKAQSEQESHKDFLEIMSVSQNQMTGIIKISIKHQSPYVAQSWAKLIVDQLNDYFRIKDKREALLAMDYLTSQMEQTSFTEIKQVIAELLKQKMQRIALIEANEFYVFSFLDMPVVMEEKQSPSRASISILGSIFGFLLGVLLVMVRQYFKD